MATILQKQLNMVPTSNQVVPMLMLSTGELSGMGAELLLRFHTSNKDRPRYTMQTHGDVDMVMALLGPDDHSKQLRSQSLTT